MPYQKQHHFHCIQWYNAAPMYKSLPCNICYLFFIVMHTNVNPSPSEDYSSGTDLSDILTEDEE